MLRDLNHPKRGSRNSCSVYQPPGRGPVPDPGINFTGPREGLLELVSLVF